LEPTKQIAGNIIKQGGLRETRKFEEQMCQEVEKGNDLADLAILGESTVKSAEKNPTSLIPQNASTRAARPSGAEKSASEAKKVQDDLLKAGQIYWQMAADRMKWQQQILAILANTETEIFEIVQEVMIRRQKIMYRIAEKWASLMLD